MDNSANKKESLQVFCEECIEGNLDIAKRIYSIRPLNLPDYLFYDSPEHVIDWLETLPKNQGCW